MDNFTISQLAQFSGIKQHTIRIWEHRYNALSPHRSEGNTRYYDSSQLRRLLNIVSLAERGFRISDLCAMKDIKLLDLVKEVQLKPGGHPVDEFYISQLISAGLSYDEAGFEKVFAHCLLTMSIRDAYIKVIYPVLERMGLMWTSDSIPTANEHFISNLMRQKLFTAIDALPPASQGASTWLCFLPEDEFHEIGLLFANYLLRNSGQKVIYLGTNVPIDSLKNVADSNKADHLLTFLVKRSSPEVTEDYVRQLVKLFKQKKILIAVNETVSLPHPPKNLKWLKSVKDLEQMLK